ncbi:hypothetical protein Tco_0290976 [Tanacetum coccineum]
MQELVRKENVADLRLKIKNLENQISHSNKIIAKEFKMKVNDMVKSVMIEKGLTKNQAYRKVYDEVYRDEHDRIEEMIMKKQLAEVELFCKIRQVLSIVEMETWIVVGWDPLVVSATLLSQSDQAMHLLVSSYPASFAIFMPYLSSDHCPCVLTLPELTTRMPRPFRFMNFLADKKEFMSYVRKNRDVFYKVNFLRAELGRVQECLDRDPSNAALREEEMVYAFAFKDAALDEEKVLQQKTKITWLKNGDFNSSYFHKVVKGRMSQNRIEVVYDDKGNPCHRDEIANIFVSHFMSFLGTHDVVYEVEDANSLFTKRLDNDVVLDLIKLVDDKEIKEALFRIDDNKASGPDGYSSKFFKAACSVVGPNLCSATKEFFVKGKLLGEFNTTLISLVPKVKYPVRVIDYRHISCCYMVYKSIDNILLAHEFIRNYTWGNMARNCAFKIDILKAYNTVSWSFLEFCLRKFRQGDPISPYLFTLVMEVLNLMIKRHVKKDSSMSKSEAFFSDLTPEIKNDILMAMPFKEGTLPIKYVGVPLVSKKINVNDCKILIEVIQNRINDWKNRNLSFAGRLLLISSVLASLQVY